MTPAVGVRPLRDLPDDARHLHALQPDPAARTVGVEPVRRDVEPGLGRGGVPAALHRPPQPPVDRDLHRHGLAGGLGGQADAVLARRLDPGLAAGRRRRLHPGHGLLPPRVDPLLACDLAPVRDRRQRLPLRRRQRPGAVAAPARALRSRAAPAFACRARRAPILGAWNARLPRRRASPACAAGGPRARPATCWARWHWHCWCWCCCSTGTGSSARSSARWARRPDASSASAATWTWTWAAPSPFPPTG